MKTSTILILSLLALTACSRVHLPEEGGSTYESASATAPTILTDAGPSPMPDAGAPDGGPRCDTPEQTCEAFYQTSNSFGCNLPCPFEGSEDSYHIYCRGWLLGLNNCDWLDPSMFPDYCAGGCR